jgi:hypothetical protein
VHKSILNRDQELVRVQVDTFIEKRTSSDTKRWVGLQHFYEGLDPRVVSKDEVVIEDQQVWPRGGLDESVAALGDADVEREKQDLVSGCNEVRVVVLHRIVGMAVIGDDQMGIRISGQDRSYETTNTLGSQECLDQNVDVRQRPRHNPP